MSTHYDEFLLYSRIRSQSEIVDIILDGLPDAWEIDHFGNLASSGISDNALNRWLNREEFISGTDPLSPFSALTLLLDRLGTEVEARFTTLSASGPGYEALNRKYTLLSQIT